MLFGLLTPQFSGASIASCRAITPSSLPRDATKMSSRPSSNQGSSWFTPLAIIAAFVTLTETVLGIGLTQVAGNIQVVLTIFVIIFPVYISTAFFYILWCRPYVFYSPAEFGATDPKHFAEAMKGTLPDRVTEQIANVEANPQDETATFQLVDSLIDMGMRQHLILMKLKGLSLSLSPFGGHKFETGSSGKGWQSGVLDGSELLKKLSGTRLVEVDPTGPSVKLTPLGLKFADWLIANGKQNQFYGSNIGGWGKVDENDPMVLIKRSLMHGGPNGSVPPMTAMPTPTPIIPQTGATSPATEPKADQPPPAP